MKITWCLLTAIANFWMINGFSTDKCSHDKLADQIEEMITCLDTALPKSVDQVVKAFQSHLATNNNVFELIYGCKDVNPIKQLAKNAKNCAVSNSISCFNETWPQTYKTYKLTRLTNLAKDILNTPSILCDELETMEKNRDGGLDKQSRRLEAIRWILDPFDAFTTLLELDKQCTPQKLLAEISKVSKCQNETEHNLTFQFEKLLDDQMPQDGSVCLSLDNALETCFIENDCISNQEMDLIKRIERVLYQISMKTVAKIRDNFGNAQALFDKLGEISFKVGKRELPNPFKPIGDHNQIHSRAEYGYDSEYDSDGEDYMDYEEDYGEDYGEDYEEDYMDLIEWITSDPKKPSTIVENMINDFKATKCQEKIHSMQQSGNSEHHTGNTNQNSENSGENIGFSFQILLSSLIITMNINM